MIRSMITALHIRDFVHIDRLDVEAGEGLIAVSGDTGAGKSVLLHALSLAVGARADHQVVRPGAERAVINVQFEPVQGHPIWRELDERGLTCEQPGILSLRRVVGADERSRAFINDQSVTIACLREIGAQLLRMHGQHHALDLFCSSTQRDILDRFGVSPVAREQCRQAFEIYVAAASELSRTGQALSNAASRAMELEALIADLDRLAAQDNEETLLLERRLILQNAERLHDNLVEARAVFRGAGGVGSIWSSLLKALQRMERIVGARTAQSAAVSDAERSHDTGEKIGIAARIGELIELTDDVFSQSQEIEARIELIGRECQSSPDELEAIEGRIADLRAAGRKYACPVTDLPALLAEAQCELGALSVAADALRAAEQAHGEAERNYRSRAEALSLARQNAAVVFSALVQREMESLRLQESRFIVHVRKADWGESGENGCDRIEFLLAAGENLAAMPISQIASGGELSRLALIFQCLLAEHGAPMSRPVFIFDEIDQGVGGATADAMGRKLRELARSGQVIAVTHSPQVAALADSHWLVQKSYRADSLLGTRAFGQLQVLNEAERVEEVARMLAGLEITPEARAASRRLMGIQARRRVGVAEMADCA